jgi:transposase-like protein
VSLTTEERARKLGVQPETLKNWRREPDFIQALDEAMKPEYLSRLKEYSRRDLLQRFVDGKTTKEDRMMAAKITGDLGPDTLVQQNTQVNIQDGRLKGTF